jgi:2-polyprenyl-3-methyl-5-hydroxy-6-metoxy-1,4-benzoquinol methylase
MAPTTIEGLRPRAPYFRKLVREHFPPDRAAQILDLGCGHGALLHFAREAGFANAIGVDGSHQQVLAARALGIPGVEERDIFDKLQSQAQESVDVVVSFDVIEHFTRDELIDFVDAVRRVLRRGGRWIIHSPNGESPFASRMRYWDYTHELSFTRTSIAQLLLSSGFTTVTSHEDAPVVHGVRSAVRAAAWALIRLGLRAYIAVETGDGRSRNIFSQNFVTVAVK